MGEELVPPDAGNPDGYFEDVRFLELNRQLLETATPELENGHRDWGWTESERFQLDSSPELVEQAQALLASRSGGSKPWGWKDPRTTLLLDFWNDLAEDAGFLLLYRYPWDVADSMQRLGAGVFLDKPDYAYRIWDFYNRKLLDFYRQNRERCVLVSTNALIQQPERWLSLLGAKLGLKLAGHSVEKLRKPDRLTTLDGEDPLIGFVDAVFKKNVERLRELDVEADLPSTGLWQVPPLKSRFPAPGTADTEDPGDFVIDVSVIAPCYDDGLFLIEAVASVERHAPDGCELLIINDGSKEPRTVEILEILRTAGYHVIDQQNQGLAAARNRGIKAARGQYVLPLDADNRLRPGFVEAAVEVMDGSQKVGVVFGDRWEFGARSGLCKIDEFDIEKLLWRNYIDACTVLRKKLWSELGGYDPAFSIWEDWELWLRAARRGWFFHRLDQVTFDYRVRPNSLVTRSEVREFKKRIVCLLVYKHRDLFQQYLPARVGIIDTWVEYLEEDLRWLREKYEEQRRQLADRDRQAEALRSDLAELREQLRRSEHRASAFHRELKKIRSGRLWQLANSFWYWVDRLLPPGSWRRSLYDRITGSSRTGP